MPKAAALWEAMLDAGGETRPHSDSKADRVASRQFYIKADTDTVLEPTRLLKLLDQAGGAGEERGRGGRGWVGEQRQRESVYHRCPEEFDGVEHADPGKKTDGSYFDPVAT